MSYSFYLFNRDAWDDPRSMLNQSDNLGRARTGDQITLRNPESGQVVTVRGDGLADSPSAARGLSQTYTISGRSFGAGSSVEMDYGFIVRDSNGIDYFVGKVKVSVLADSLYNGSVMSEGWNPVTQEWVGPPPIGTTFTLISVGNDYPGGFNPWQRGGGGLREGPTAFNPYSNDVRLGSGVAAPVLKTGFFPFCFAAGTLIETETGPRLIEELLPGDRILTCDAGLQELRWVGRRHISSDVFSRMPKWCPVRISAGALGAGLPKRDMMVSPQHRVLIRSRIAQRMFDADELLVAAKDLVGLEGIARADDITQVDYIHLMFDAHRIVLAEGAPMESFYLGPMVLRSLDIATRNELLELFPYMENETAAFARPVVTGGPARNLVSRHQRNAQPLVFA